MALLLLLVLGAPPAAGSNLLNKWGTARLARAHPTCNEVSTSIGSTMVLQRAPESAVVFGSVCGKLSGANSVSVAVDGGAPTTAPIAPGSHSWEVKLPPQAGGLKPHTLKISGGSFVAGPGFNLAAANSRGPNVLCCGSCGSRRTPWHPVEDPLDHLHIENAL
jgi:hypothetical protein